MEAGAREEDLREERGRARRGKRMIKEP